VDCKPGTGKKRRMGIAQNVGSVEELELSQENVRAFTNNSSDSRDRNSQIVSA